jgi:hypothetical protein
VKVPGRIIYQGQNPKRAHQFSATTGTIFQDTHLPLDKRQWPWRLLESEFQFRWNNRESQDIFKPPTSCVFK